VDLILWRHAEAEDGAVDLDRALTLRGHKQAARMAGWLGKRLPAGARILVSPAARTRQTALALTQEFIVDDRLAPGAMPADLLEAAGWPDASGTSVVIGHQPGLGRVVHALLVGTPGDWPIRKGAIVWLRNRERDRQAQVVLRAALAPELI
jgi:phosphohistidine phosphatase